jgi:hypothetical protein
MPRLSSLADIAGGTDAGCRQPAPARRPRGRRDPDRSWTAPAIAPGPWTRLNKAEDLLDALEAQPRVGLDVIEQALTMLLLARRDFGRPQRKRRKPRPSNPPRASS